MQQKTPAIQPALPALADLLLTEERQIERNLNLVRLALACVALLVYGAIYVIAGDQGTVSYVILGSMVAWLAAALLLMLLLAPERYFPAFKFVSATVDVAAVSTAFVGTLFIDATPGSRIIYDTVAVLFALLALTTLRQRPASSIYTGVLAAVVFMAANYGVQWFGGSALPPLQQGAVAVALLAASGASAFVARRQRSMLWHAIAAEQERLQKLHIWQLGRLEAEVNARTAELGAAKEAAESANDSKTRMISMISHDLRAPLSAIIGAGELLEIGIGGDLSAQQQHWVEVMTRNASQALQIVDDLVNLSALEAGRLEVVPIPFDLTKIAREVVETAGNLPAKREAVALVLDLPEALPAVHGDPNRIRQVLVNLVGNALKFTAEGQVTVGAAANGSDVHIWVADTGVGLTPDEASRVFTEFEQTEEGRRAGGAGLGLSISQLLLNAHGSRLAVESEKGRGSRFVFTLPVAGPVATANDKR